MKKEIGALFVLAFALTSCEMEEKREHKMEERAMKHAQETPAAPAEKTNGMEKAPEAPKPLNPVQK